MNELELQSVFQDTVSKSAKTKYGKTTKHYSSEIGGPYGKISDNITVENSDTVTSLTKWSGSGRTCALNMASYKRPGGGVERGAKAQEECLFRCSNLTHSISKDFYPLTDDSCLYTEDSLFFKDRNYDMMEPAT
jgi:uncharacterized protein (TIGR02452 family)